MTDNATNDLMNRLNDSLATSRESTGRTKGLLYPELSYAIGGALIEVHRGIGAGKLESVYQRALEHELALRRIPFEAQVPIDLDYKGVNVGDFVADIIVDGLVILELKAVERVHSHHVAQVLSYLKATQLRLGLLVNFNSDVVSRNVRRIVL